MTAFLTLRDLVAVQLVANVTLFLAVVFLLLRSRSSSRAVAALVAPPAASASVVHLAARQPDFDATRPRPRPVEDVADPLGLLADEPALAPASLRAAGPTAPARAPVMTSRAQRELLAAVAAYAGGALQASRGARQAVPRVDRGAQVAADLRRPASPARQELNA